MTAIRRVQEVTEQVFQLVDSGELFDTILVACPLWLRSIDPSGSNTVTQIREYYLAFKALFEGLKTLSNPAASMWVAAQDSFMQMASVAFPEDNPAYRGGKKMLMPLEADNIVMFRAAERLVADALGINHIPDNLFYDSKQEGRKQIVVKWNSRRGSMLMVDTVLSKSVYVSVTGGSLAELNIEGWIPSEELTKHTTSTGANAQTYYADPSMLYRSEDLISKFRTVKPFELAGLPWRIASMGQMSHWYLKGEFLVLYPTWEVGLYTRNHENLFWFSQNNDPFYRQRPELVSWLNVSFEEAWSGLIDKTTPNQGKILGVFTNPAKLDSAVQRANTPGISYTCIN